MSEFKIGDRVYTDSMLEIGTVIALTEDGEVDVEWFCAEKGYKNWNDLYHPDDLTLVTHEMDQEFEKAKKQAQVKLAEATEAMKKFSESIKALDNLSSHFDSYGILYLMRQNGLCKELEQACEHAGWSASSIYC